VDIDGWFWSDLGSFRGRTYNSHLPNKTCSTPGRLLRSLAPLLAIISAVFKGSGHQILVEPPNPPMALTAAFKERGRRTEILGEEGQVDFISTGYLARNEFLSLPTFGSV